MPRREDIPYLLRARSAPASDVEGAQGLSEALCFPARLLSKLPTESRFVLYAHDLPCEITLVTKELPEPRETAEPGVLLDGVELDALVCGVEAERFLAADLRRLCEAKLTDPARRLTSEEALAGAQPVGEPLTLAELLRRLEVALLAVHVEPEGSPDGLTQAA